MRKKIFLLLCFALFFSDSFYSQNKNKIGTSKIPGLYEQTVFNVQQLSVYTDVVYSVRPNFKNLQYTSGKTKDTEIQQNELELKMDIAVPPNASATQKQPLIFYIHGGNFISGDKTGGGVKLITYAQAGYVIASINYRLTAKNKNTPKLREKAIKDAQEDAQNAIRFLKKNAEIYYIDTARICVMGSSAGGATALIAAVEYDNPIFKNDYKGFSAKVQAVVSTGATLINDEIDANKLKQLHFDTGDVPTLIFHAKETDKNSRNTWTNSVIPTQKLFLDAGIPCELAPQPDMTHIVDLKLGGVYWQYIKPFIWKHLGMDLVKY